MKKIGIAVLTFALSLNLIADIKVSNVEVFSGYPWKEVLVAYTINGTDPNADLLRLTATDKSTNKSYTAKSLKGMSLSEGRHVVRWDTTAEEVTFSSANVEFAVQIVTHGVQLWEDGPYWAECNVGATQPQEDGYYFFWGDTVGYTRSGGIRNGGSDTSYGSSFYDYSGVTWVSSAGARMSSSPFSSNCPTADKTKLQLQSLGYIDSTGNLTAAHDAATAHLGARWRMPTTAEFSALLNKCDATWARHKGVDGCLFTGRGAYSSKRIFLPAAGWGSGSTHFSDGSRGRYWSSTLGSADSYNYGWSFWFYSDNTISIKNDYRIYGQPVRPVRMSVQ